MRYPASDDIISIHTSVISFLTNELTVFLRPAIYMPLFFSVVWTFWSFPLVFSRVEVLIFLYKMETSRLFEITDEELVELVEEQENPNTKKITAYALELFKLTLACLVQHLFMSFITVSSERRPFEIYLALEKKMAPTFNPQV